MARECFGSRSCGGQSLAPQARAEVEQSEPQRGRANQVPDSGHSHEHRHEGHRKQRSAVGLYLFGAAMYIPSIFYLTATHEVAKSHPGVVPTGLALLLITVIVLLFVEVPILLYVLAPDRTARILGGWNAWLSRHARTIIVVAAAVIGAYLLVTGIVDLVN